MKLGIFNVDSVLETELCKKVHVEILDWDKTIPTGLDCMFINWIPKNSKDMHRLVHQTNLLQHAISLHIPTAVFDSTIDLTDEESDYLVKNKVLLFEPRLKSLHKSIYLPFWINIPDDVELCEDHPKSIDFGYIEYKDILSDEHKFYYKGIIDTYPSINVDQVDSYKKAKCTVLIDIEKHYINGYLHDISCILASDCLPLLPYKHRFYHSLFKDLVIRDIKDMKYLIDNYDLMCYGLKVDMYHRIRKYFPEMRVENVAKKIIESLKES
jgi:hypothetical protein